MGLFGRKKDDTAEQLEAMRAEIVALRERLDTTDAAKSRLEENVGALHAENGRLRVALLGQSATAPSAALDAGRDVRQEAGMLKVFATEMAQDAVDNAMQCHGAMGVTKELPLQLLAQQVRVMRVYEGPSEVHRMAIARRVLKELG